MAIPPTSLGSLGKLPAELRLPIWADVISSRRPAVLRASRAIYEEIVHELNDVLEYTLFPHYKHPWLRVHSPRTGLTFVITRRDGKKIRKRLWQLPYNNTVLTIHLMAPNPKKPGEIALLWQKAHDLVGILDRAKYHRAHIVLVFRETERRCWQEAKTPTQSIPHPGDPRPDFLIAFLPFCRLSRVRKIEVVRVTLEGQRVPIRWRFVKYGCDFIMNDGYKTYNDSDYSRKPKYRRISRAFDNVDRMLAETDFFLETTLDLLPGHTAAMLRLDRFARWFTISDPDDSPYQRRYLLTLREYPHVVDTYDPQLSRLTERHRAFEIFYFTVSGSENAVARSDGETGWLVGLRPLCRLAFHSTNFATFSQSSLKDERTKAHRQSADTFPDLRSATTPKRETAFTLSAIDLLDPDGSTYTVSDPQIYNMGGPDLETGQAFEKKGPIHIRMPPLSYQTSRAQSEASQSEISLKDRAETER
ncbi:hypothetical protein ATEIFO6365_0002032100 [Aspergillus terreus]|uniref:Uncharacterized protein n=1 Tax=Aspergillus terreus TaxID=33178 RepID=A0A5M3YU42_ASPTE|nr:hypothetical protein ATETN484_0004032100 [Aspergillus terreus]GFF13211.1 hypothetical protein ATEIFO6365_0002032100 [Aspergillus terreus]